ncbi:DoxX family protein [Fulvivirgaceae bacterium PWU4]|uniref:DoxX family protein n=1 Tax=Chryseosolibacter histidini TaxID=2782349 RepID=A0AAP2DJ18_9BACT|nr:DoxX family protein [Chryseosolibacter histidini]MBT1697110.1 DoxX family protein [Chryseosolibacter histidini]
MATVAQPALSKGRLWTARIMGGLVIAFMLVDSIFKFIVNEQVAAGAVELGFQAHHLPVMGSLGLISILLFAFPRTEILGAVLLTGYFGGVVATHLRLDNPLFSHILFPVYLAILAWGSLWIRNDRVKKLFLNQG